MALQDLQQQIVQLPIHDRWLLVQTLLDSIQRDTHTNASPSLASQPSDVSNESVLDDLPKASLVLLNSLQMTARKLTSITWRNYTLETSVIR